MAIIGIDLGTTNSAVAYIKNEKPEIIENREGGRTTPSVFHVTKDGQIVVGNSAKSAIVSMPDHVVTEVKRFMGTDEKLNVAGEVYRPEEISANILKELKLSAEDKLGEEVTEAVITVPAYFSDSQRKATQKAGELAGLKVDRIINEPTAAAIAYGLDNMDKEQYILVYDLGGGTFDVSVVELFEGVVDVKASGGNNTLGGMDFDQRIVDYIVEEFEKMHGINLLHDGSQQEIVLRKNRLKEEAERVKKLLSTQVSVNISVPMILLKDGMPLSVDLELSRIDFEKMVDDLLSSTLVEVDKVLEDTGIGIDQIDEVLLVGGSTRIPSVQELVERKFNKSPRKDINPDEAVALGAAIQVGIKNETISSQNGLVVTDVAPYNLGIEIIKVIGGQKVPGYFDIIINRNSTIPKSETKYYHTVEDHQTSFNIQVFQGDAEKTIDNTFLGNIEINDVPANPAGQEGIEITFHYDINGNLKVTAKLTSTGKTVNAEINNNGVMSDLEVSQSKRKMEQAWDQSELYKEVKAVMYRAEKVRDELDSNQQASLDAIMNNLKGALSQNDAQPVKKYEEQLTDYLMEVV
ncbi:Hsp70 family protein [Gracilibacillus massiliensis]|uniref:Hsp70 family protein n=1 Tax=Gracilibacillus massiliensis TaxID=1564956 RepID=UPI00071D7710|nr:Hsp70 family protein [Gracilibacillus massiliensis]